MLPVKTFEDELRELELPEVTSEAMVKKAPGSLVFYRLRASRTLTRVPEIIYMLGKHWVLLGVCGLIAGIAVWLALVSSPVTYIGQAQLLVNRDPVSLPGSDTRTGYINARDQNARFLAAQVKILESAKVRRILVNSVGIDSYFAEQEEEPSTLRERIRASLGELTGGLLGLVGLGETESEEFSDDEQKTRLAIDSFGRRSAVEPDPESNAILLEIRSRNSTALYRELESWIEAYRTHVADMDRQHNIIFNDLIESYTEAQEESLKTVMEFKLKNPDVSQERLEHLDQRLQDLRTEATLIQRQLVEGLNASDPLSELGRLLQRKNELEDQLDALLIRGLPETNDRVVNVRSLIKKTDEEIARLSTEQSTAGVEGVLRERLAALYAEGNELLSQKSSLRDRLRFLQNLEENYQSARDRRIKYETKYRESADRLVVLPAKIQVLDEPLVAQEPQRAVLKLGAGVFGGFLLGWLLALGLEVFNSRVRFKHDIVTDFDLPVVGVIPKR